MSTMTRIGLVTALSAAMAAVLASCALSAAGSLLGLPPHLWGATHVDEMLVALLASAGTAGALWYTLSGLLALTTLAAGPRAPGSRSATRLLARWGAPYVRRAALGALGASLVVSGTAVAQQTPPLPDDLGWSPTVSSTSDPTDTAADASSNAHPAAEPATGPSPHESPSAASSASATYTVQDGDSLWSITSSLLQPDETTGEIPDETTGVATAWPALYQANDDVIGLDPDLILPGTVLTVPAALTDQP